MLTLFTGAPGAGKTAQMVAELHQLLKRESQRPIYVDGVNGLTIPHTPIDASKWPDELPDGALMLVDEVQRLWRPAGPGAKITPDIAAMETHRHRGIDIWMTTQSPGLLHGNVRKLIGRHIHIRDTGFLGRWWYEWPECSENVAWRTCTNKHKHKLPKSIFALYKSASLHVKPERRVPIMAVIAIAAVIGTAVLSYLGYNMISRKLNPTQAKPAATAPGQMVNAPATPSGGATGARVLPVHVTDPTAFTQRFFGRPESAPAYDELVKVKTFPRIVAAICRGAEQEKCMCLTQQGTNSGMSDAECRTWSKSPPFDPYREPVQLQPTRTSDVGMTPAPSATPS